MKNIISTKNLNLFYGDKKALFDINIDLPKKKVTALIGPSGCGKSSFLRCLNRMNDEIEGTKIMGSVLYNEHDIYEKNTDLTLLREKVGMVFQKPNPFPKSIYDNVIYGVKIHGKAKNKAECDEIVEKSLTRAGLWEEVKNRLNDRATSLSGGQQQRLCIARTIAISPNVILMDEPCSALDPIATAKIEDLITELKEKYTIIIVTHSMTQAKRVSDYTAYFYEGKIIEYNKTKEIFENPQKKSTKQYILGKFG